MIYGKDKMITGQDVKKYSKDIVQTRKDGFFLWLDRNISETCRKFQTPNGKNHSLEGLGREPFTLYGSSVG